MNILNKLSSNILLIMNNLLIILILFILVILFMFYKNKTNKSDENIEKFTQEELANKMELDRKQELQEIMKKEKEIINTINIYEQKQLELQKIYENDQKILLNMQDETKKEEELKKIRELFLQSDNKIKAKIDSLIQELNSIRGITY
jgi:hypothetical protein